MKERPILFKDEMIRAILEGRKTQTRRIAKNVVEERSFRAGWKAIHRGKKGATSIDAPATLLGMACPYGEIGDRLWVREAWAMIDKDYKPADLAKATALVYRADGLKVPNQRDREIRAIFADRCRFPMDEIKWRPSIHMPRVASRVTLEIVSVRVEQLKDISEEDARSEGAPPSHPSIDRISREFGHPDFSRSWFAQLWESINGPGSWDANPWVWVVEFKRVQP